MTEISDELKDVIARLERRFLASLLFERFRSTSFYWPPSEAVSRDDGGITTIDIPAGVTDCDELVVMVGDE